jgi:hypothetical protein
MRLATYKGEKKISELVERFYRIEGRGSRAVTKEAEEALLKANPHLGDLRKLRDGAVIVVPPVAEASDTAAATPFEELTRDLADHLRQALDQVDLALADSIRAEVEDAREAASLSKSREFKALADKFAPVKDRLASVMQAAKVRLEQAEAADAMRKRAVSRLEKQLAALANRLA